MVAGKNYRYVWHCHILEHEDNEMTTSSLNRKRTRPVNAMSQEVRCDSQEKEKLLLDGFVGRDLAVADENDAMRVLGDVVLVCHENDRVALAVQVCE